MSEPTLEPRLFRGAPIWLAVHAGYVMGAGWQLRIAVGHEGEQTAECEQQLYDHLTTPELHDVVAAAAFELLGL